MRATAVHILKRSFLLGFLGWLCVACSVEASEPKFSSEVKIKYKWMNYGNVLPVEYSRKTNFLQYCSWKPENNVEIFGRFAWQQSGGDTSRLTESRMDKCGVRIWQGNMKWILGTSDVYLGSFGGLLDLSDNVINGFFTGADLTIREKNSHVRVQSGRLDKTLFLDNHSRDMIVVQIGGKWEKTRWAATTLNIPGLYEAERFVDFSLKHPDGKANYMAEIIQSSGAVDNDALLVGVNYKPDKKYTFVLLGGRTGKTAVPGGSKSMGAYDNGLRGHQLQIFRTIGTSQVSFKLAQAHSTVYKMDVTKTELTYKRKF